MNKRKREQETSNNASKRFKSDFAETITLVDAGSTANHIKAYATWPYSQSLDLGYLAEASQVEVCQKLHHDHANWRRFQLTNSLVTLWVSGDYLQDSGFKNAVMDAMLRHTEDCIGIWDVAAIQTVLRIWDFTTDSSRLRQWLIDFTFPSFTEIDIKLCHDLGKDLPLEFLVALFKKSLQEKEGGVQFSQPGFADRCVYHEHLGADEGCAWA
ncbi:hypothetical protein EJ03DRAFT_356196 [Teratosphaeria nubilosa]|uniref:BTB domain-containing protein n=1 Tax=Teratosphaeria nubilosa TaxID=161662 RepID=A0A6G1KTM5_9PEZI|nr:hypothetical protein EJ03DRAFT_356196 [Teratosphaeria nubilosa]